jgi:hypothetical protein
VHKDLKFGALKKPCNHPRFSTDPFDGVAEFAAEMWQIETAHIPELDPLEVAPEPFARIQFGGIGRQPLHVEPSGRAIGQELLDDLATVNRGTIPDDDHTTGHLPQHMLEEGNHVCRMDGAVLAVEVQFALQGEGADRGEMSTGPPRPQGGRMAHRRIRPHNARKGIKPRLVYEAEGLLKRLGPFWMAGQVSWCQ